MIINKGNQKHERLTYIETKKENQKKKNAKKFMKEMKLAKINLKLINQKHIEERKIKNDIFIQEKYLYATIDKKNELIKRQKTIQRKIKGLSEKKINQYIDEIEEQEEENEEEDEIVEIGNGLIVLEKMIQAF